MLLCSYSEILTFEVQVSIIVLPKPMTTRPPTTSPKELTLVPDAEIMAPSKMAIEQAIEPLDGKVSKALHRSRYGIEFKVFLQ